LDNDFKYFPTITFIIPFKLVTDRVSKKWRWRDGKREILIVRIGAENEEI
jgi:hypothetical protein